MTTTSERITDKEKFDEIINGSFSKYNVFIKTETMNVNVTFVKYENGIIFIQSQEALKIAENALIFSRCKENIVCASAKLFNKEGEDYYLFQPKHIEIITVERKEERKSISGFNDEQKIVYITNIISDFILKDCLLFEKKKVNLIRDKLLSKLEKAYRYSKVFFINEKKNDERMMYFNKERKPIFMPDIKKDVVADEEIKEYTLYKKQFYEKDKAVEWNKIVSEISLPFLYKSLIPFGYLQINDVKVLTENEFTALKKVCISTVELFSNNNIIKTSEDKIFVADFSKSGMGIVFKNRRLIKHFKDESSIFFNLVLPENKIAAILAIVRNINLIGNNIFRIGCEIIEIDAIGQCHYDEYLEKK